MNTQLAIAVVGAITAIAGAFFTANAASDVRVSGMETKVEVIRTTQTLQYTELKDEITTIKQDVKEILKAVK